MILKDKIILVTGGSGLLGKAFLADIKQKGGLAINVDINVTDNLKDNTLYCDVTDPEAIKKVIETTLDYFGRIDGLVNNAYPRTADWGTPFEDIPIESWRKNIDMQLNSYVLFCQGVIPLMKKQKQGAIVNIASIYGVVSQDPNMYIEDNMNTPAAYSAIKGGLINFTRYLAAYYGKQGIRVNCVSPGGIFDNQPKKFVKKYEERVPLGRMGNANDIAPSVSFLLSDDAKYITGHNLLVDGGWTAI
jgi:NAD(P)-dependent dehydrogenase (short-subunit alcohol dehydrogenase family)